MREREREREREKEREGERARDRGGAVLRPPSTRRVWLLLRQTGARYSTLSKRNHPAFSHHVLIVLRSHSFVRLLACIRNSGCMLCGPGAFCVSMPLRRL